MLTAICSSSYAAVMAYSVADDNFEMPDHLVQIDLTTGEYQSMGQIADPYIALEGLAISANGTLYGADDNTKTLVQINPSEGRAFPVANANQNLGFGSIPDSYDFGMSFACDNNLYMVVKHTQELFQVNTVTGAATLIGNTGHNFTSLAAWGNDLFAVASGDFNLYQVDPSTAAATVVGSLGDLGGDIELAGSGLAFDEDGDLWMAVNLRLSDPLNPFPSRIFSINTDTGEASLVSETLVGIESLAIAGPGGCNAPQGTPVLVPASNTLTQSLMLLLLLGVGLMALRRTF
ncbi:DUF6923 family protein [Marinicella meishanensis]|uniref:DUF6923 family protein n=1 Tax=Marinicella meishanensis TaxID=2873263 RepID=UPI001CBE1307|nr:hypothetical protein [Marinicella sp. NBU2979]